MPVTAARASPRQPGLRSPARKGRAVRPWESGATAASAALERRVVAGQGERAARPGEHVAAFRCRAAYRWRRRPPGSARVPTARRAGAVVTRRSAADVPTFRAMRSGPAQSAPRLEQAPSPAAGSHGASRERGPASAPGGRQSDQRRIVDGREAPGPDAAGRRACRCPMRRPAAMRRPAGRGGRCPRPC